VVLGNQEVELVPELEGKSRPAGHFLSSYHPCRSSPQVGRDPTRRHGPDPGKATPHPTSSHHLRTTAVHRLDLDVAHLSNNTTCGLGCSASHASCLPSLPEPLLANQPIRCPSDWQTGHPRLTSLGISSWSNKPPAPPLRRSQQVIRYLAHVPPREPTVLHSSFERQHLRKPPGH
jgi:hypothetical protein